ncbi:hypothetical protein HPP92_026826 [Vanilla planifolia]|uniref:Uncharacterized protein n=1 Tax=Vanilla planifolia TaxID=51239 RepID=A0A835PDA0_VANPL|nr:hypothetical protein HPP92_027014 [Vanilla planifolia]KAG0450300.1 hypothetical protein HPP92_026826 [Vanilla planifolia]
MKAPEGLGRRPEEGRDGEAAGLPMVALFARRIFASRELIIGGEGPGIAHGGRCGSFRRGSGKGFMEPEEVDLDRCQQPPHRWKRGIWGGEEGKKGEGGRRTRLRPERESSGSQEAERSVEEKRTGQFRAAQTASAQEQEVVTGRRLKDRAAKNGNIDRGHEGPAVGSYRIMALPLSRRLTGSRAPSVLSHWLIALTVCPLPARQCEAACRAAGGFL